MGKIEIVKSLKLRCANLKSAWPDSLYAVILQILGSVCVNSTMPRYQAVIMRKKLIVRVKYEVGHITKGYWNTLFALQFRL